MPSQHIRTLSELRDACRLSDDELVARYNVARVLITQRTYPIVTTGMLHNIIAGAFDNGTWSMVVLLTIIADALADRLAFAVICAECGEPIGTPLCDRHVE